jgi:hypothetical protein
MYDNFENIKDYLREIYHGYRIIEPLEVFPELKHFYHCSTRKLIVDLEHVFIITNDPVYKIDYWHPQSPKTLGTKTFLVIAEENPVITTTQINDVNDCLQTASNIYTGVVNNTDAFTKSFLWRMNAFRLYDFEPTVQIISKNT